VSPSTVTRPAKAPRSTEMEMDEVEVEDKKQRSLQRLSR
jgi:hypothetical protein